MLVVQQQMVGMAEERPVGKVRTSVVFEPLVDVMRFCPRWRFLTVDPEASAVAYCHCGALFLGEESIVAADVDDLAVVVEFDAAGAGVAEQPVDGFLGDGERVALDLPVSGRFGRPVFVDLLSRRWRARTRRLGARTAR